MSDNLTKPKKKISADWLVGGILTKLGETFDRLTGRNWKPSSSLATSELIDRLRKLLDAEVKDFGEKGRFVPHNIKLKMQWNKFSTDAEDSLRKLEYEMLAAAIDHINDNRYHTYKPLKIEIKPDYFTEGVKFLASFGEFDEEEKEAVINISVPQIKVGNLISAVQVNPEPESESYIAEFSVNEKQKSVELKFIPGKRVGVGRTKENDLSIEDPSVSKIHAAFVLNPENQLMVADTGSTNGTFINGQRIAYGRAFPVSESDKLKFGTIEVYLRLVPKQTAFEPTGTYQTANFRTENYQTDPPAENFRTNQDYQTNLDPPPTVQDFETNRDYPTYRQDQPTEAYSSKDNYPVIPNSVVNNTVSSNETNASIPVPQPNLTFQTAAEFKPELQPKIESPKEDIKLNNSPKIESPKAENVKNSEAGENRSQVFSTEPRVKLNFDDDE